MAAPGITADVASPTVYFLQTGDPDSPVKIGYTARPTSERLREAKTFSAETLYILTETMGSQADEAALHRRFTGHRLRGEWFRYEGELRELVMYLLDGGSLQSWLSANGDKS